MFNLLFRIYTEPLLMVYLYDPVNRNRRYEVSFGEGFGMNGDHSLLHADTGVTSGMFVERSLNEIRFWARIMKEHSLFLRLGFRAEDTQLIQEANEFYQLFERIEQAAHSFNNQTDPEQIRRFNSEVGLAATNIFAFKRKILRTHSRM